MEEIWKDIQGYEGSYQISNIGRVKSLKRNKERIMHSTYDSWRYRQVGLWKNGKNKIFKIQRLVAMTFIPNPKQKPEVNHIDGNKDNNCVDNLEWVTSSENTLHAYKTGLKKYSLRCGNEARNHKLTWDDVHYIREHYVKRSKDSNSYTLAKKFNVKPNAILRIVNNKTWKE